MPPAEAPAVAVAVVSQLNSPLVSRALRGFRQQPGMKGHRGTSPRADENSLGSLVAMIGTVVLTRGLEDRGRGPGLNHRSEHRRRHQGRHHPVRGGPNQSRHPFGLLGHCILMNHRCRILG